MFGVAVLVPPRENDGVAPDVPGVEVAVAVGLPPRLLNKDDVPPGAAAGCEAAVAPPPRENPPAVGVLEAAGAELAAAAPLPVNERPLENDFGPDEAVFEPRLLNIPDPAPAAGAAAAGVADGCEAGCVLPPKPLNMLLLPVVCGVEEAAGVDVGAPPREKGLAAGFGPPSENGDEAAGVDAAGAAELCAAWVVCVFPRFEKRVLCCA